MKTNTSYTKFINNINKKLEYYSSELHFTIDMCSILINNILKSDNQNVINYFTNIEFLDTFSFNDLLKFNIDEDPILYSNIKLYYTYIYNRIPYFKTMLYNYSIIIFLMLLDIILIMNYLQVYYWEIV